MTARLLTNYDLIYGGGVDVIGDGIKFGGVLHSKEDAVGDDRHKYKVFEGLPLDNPHTRLPEAIGFSEAKA